jgi:hypothetical protein
MVLGVPAVACGGRVIVEGTQGEGGGGAPTATATETATGSASSSATGGPTGTVTPTTTGSGTSAPPSFGNFPCTAYTAWYYSCPPIAGTGGCKYAIPANGDPVNGWADSTTQSQAPGCQLEIVAPTDVGGSTCATVALCSCDSASTWVPENGQSYCPNN